MAEAEISRLRRRSRRVERWFIRFILGALAALGAVIFLPVAGQHAYRHWHEHRSIQGARHSLAADDYGAAETFAFEVLQTSVI